LAPPAPHDIDSGQLNRQRLRSLALKMGLDETLKRWLAGHLLEKPALKTIAHGKRDSRKDRYRGNNRS
jgi:hypothetical protein